MSSKIYIARKSFVLYEDTVRQDEKRSYNDDALEADLLQAGYIEEFDEAREIWGTTDLSYMFYQGNRTGILQDVITKASSTPLTAIDAMCAYCYYVQEIDVSTLDVSGISDFNRVFLHCESLEELDLSAWDTTSLQTSEYMLAYTKALTKLIINNSARVLNLTNANALEGSAIAGGTGYVYVPDSMINAYKAHPVWGLYASQIKSTSELSA